MDWSIQEIARLTGTTSRTLRHYDAIGLLTPSRIADNGYRHYDESGLLRLQRILLLRELGMSLTDIAEALVGSGSPTSADMVSALGHHVNELGRERSRIERQIASVTATIRRLEAGEPLMVQEMFDGFDHRQYEEEVTERWGQEAYRTSAQWWESMSQTEQNDWKARVTALSQDWTRAAEAGADPRSQQCQDLAKRHIEWLRSVPGTPASQPGGDLEGYVRGLADMYVADERFAANYGSIAGAQLVKDALIHHLETAEELRS